MKQIFLSGGGQISLLDSPIPARLRDSVLVRNAYSLISSGTEGQAVTLHSGWRGLYEKAMSSRERVGQVWAMAQTQGLGATARLVRSKVEDLNPIGYSSAGLVVEVDNEELPFSVGDRVACMGAGFANHAEYVVVPKNLVTKIPEGVPLEQAAFGSLACIALQGIRRLDLTPGERVGVVGLGLIGQICVRLLVALGYDAVGFDPLPGRVELAEQAGAAGYALAPGGKAPDVSGTGSGYGLDGVIICAATDSHEPVNMAFELCRKRGRVSIVGEVGLHLLREKMYAKELELRLSCSYGPGRYDPNYEIGGHDYPIEHARWTEGRNLELVLRLLQTRRLDLSPLISRSFELAEASSAYAFIKSGNPASFGVLLDYRAPKDSPAGPPVEDRTIRRAGPVHRSARAGAIRLGFIGVGGYAKGMHLPNLKKLNKEFDIRVLASRSGSGAASGAQRFDVPVATSDYDAVFGDPDIDAVLICTRHASHAGLITAALEAGKHVFVEKPMTVTVEEAERVVALAEQTGLVVRVGFNRRFSPHMRALLDCVGAEGLRQLLIRVNIGSVSGDWSNTTEEGGRLLGEGVHFFDLCNWFAGEEPSSVAAVFAGPNTTDNPNVTACVSYPNGCSGQLLYTALGATAMGKEYFEAFGNGRSARCDDFKGVSAFGGRVKLPRGSRGDKGQMDALREFAAAIKGTPFPVKGADARAGLLATWMAHAVRESARTGEAIARPEKPRNPSV